MKVLFNHLTTLGRVPKKQINKEGCAEQRNDYTCRQTVRLRKHTAHGVCRYEQPGRQLLKEAVLEFDDEFFEITAEDGRIFLSKSVVVAAGGGIIPPQRLQVAGAERYEITNLHYTVQSLSTFRDKTVLISGGGNAAIDWANLLEDVARKVILSCRNDTLKAHESEVDKLLCSSIDCQFRSSIKRLIADESGTKIDRVELQCGTDSGKIVDIDHVLVNHGYERELGFLKETSLALDLTEKQQISATADGRTNVEGLFAAGDVMQHDGKLNLLAGAFQDAGNAVNASKQYIDPSAQAKGKVSSHNEVFAARNAAIKQSTTT